MPKFLLIRRKPTGEIDAPAHAFNDTPHAARCAGLQLARDGAAGSVAARLFGDALGRRPIGTVWGHPSGYDFRILEAAFTEDGAPITPGMRVFNYYDHEWGTIDAGQFMHEGDLSPGGKFFDHFYDFTRENESRSFKKLNGQRLATKERP